MYNLAILFADEEPGKEVAPSRAVKPFEKEIVDANRIGDIFNIANLCLEWKLGVEVDK